MNNGSRDAGRQMNFFGIDYPELIKSQERDQEPEKRGETDEHDNASDTADTDGAQSSI